jgi:hypothetical protein
VPDIAHLKAFGTKCISWNPESHQLSKLHPRGESGYMVGYHNDSTSMYLVSTVWDDFLGVTQLRAWGIEHTGHDVPGTVMTSL